jgi:tripartite-type tricarboxylate transporter receptor subunit TctC
MYAALAALTIVVTVRSFVPPPATVILALLVAVSNVHAQGFPERPVQIITPYAAGGGLDIITRTLAQRMSALWGKHVLVDNKPGAGSTLGTALAAKAPKDGHTLLVASTPLGVAPAVYATLPFAAMRDPSVRKALAAQGWDFVGLGSREFAAFLDKELPKLTSKPISQQPAEAGHRLAHAGQKSSSNCWQNPFHLNHNASSRRHRPLQADCSHCEYRAA